MTFWKEKGGIQSETGPRERNIGIVKASWNAVIVDELVERCKSRLEKRGCKVEMIVTVPGSYELPFAAKRALKSNPALDAIICIGVLVKGETFHFEVIANAVSQGIMNVSLELEKPVIFGVLTLLEEKQAECRMTLAESWADAAISMTNPL